LKIEEAKDLMRKLLEVVSYLHAVGICHRDLKPDNLIVANDMSIKLIDFNVSV
jgi:serine/threonine protein kinase